MNLIALLIATLLAALAATVAIAQPPSPAEADSKVQVAAYYFPNWGPEPYSEWGAVKVAKPRFAGHAQPKVPLWGYENENDPTVMAHKIDSAADHGLDAFIFDWYYYDRVSSESTGPQDPASHWDGSKYLSSALEHGYLGAPNNERVRFAVMWCNHDLGTLAKGAVSPETFDRLADYVIEKYFKHPAYWKIDGCPYFSIYEVDTFLQTFGGDVAKAVDALDRFRSKVQAVGFPDLHLNGVLFALGRRGNSAAALTKELKLDSATSYTWIHHYALPDFPATDFDIVANAYFQFVEHGGGHNGLEQKADTLGVPYFLNVSMGWDSSPRCPAGIDWMAKRTPYPLGAVITGNTPERFQEALARAKALTLQRPPNERIITINSWNEWGEGSYLEPDTVHGLAYLQAIQSVFATGK